MTRKNVLQGLLAGTGDGPAPAPLPRAATGAIGAVGRSIADLRARAVIDIDPFLIDGGGLADRVESDDADDAALARSIAEYGQQVPVLVRPHPTEAGRYQIVYGRRRVLALRDLGLSVKALVRDLDDQALVLAQGQENTARRNLSFIEKVNFARQMRDAGYDRKVVGDALSIDKTLVSRMFAVADRVPQELIEMIGSAPSVGRDRWLALVDAIANEDVGLQDVKSMIGVSNAGSNSDARFAAAAQWLARRSALPAPALAPPERDMTGPRSHKQAMRGADGMRLGQVIQGPRSITLRFDTAQSSGFESWLLARLSDLHAEWGRAHGDQGT